MLLRSEHGMENEIYDRKEDGMAGEMVDEKDNGEDNIMLKIIVSIS